MAEQLNFSLVSPTQQVFSGEVEHVIAPGSLGEFGILPNHAPFMSSLQNGLVKILEGDKVVGKIFVQGGFADVTQDGLTILAERAFDLTDARIEDIKAKAESALSEDDKSFFALVESYVA